MDLDTSDKACDRGDDAILLRNWFNSPDERSELTEPKCPLIRIRSPVPLDAQTDEAERRPAYRKSGNLGPESAWSS